MSFLEDWLLPVLVDYGLVAIFVTMTLESACIPIPSEIVVPYGGFLAARGHVELWEVVAVASLANLAGSVVSYAGGRYGGRSLFLRYGRYLLMSPHHLEAAERWFKRRGEITVFLTRMMPGVRTFISVPAGVARMPFGRFVFYSFLGAIPWNAALALLGLAFGENWEELQAYFHRYKPLFLVFVGLLLAALLVWKWRDMKRSRSSVLG